MARYVDIEPVHKEIDAIQTSLESNDDKKWYKNKPYYKGLAVARQIMNEQPIADVVEVKRGEWIKKFKYSHGYDDYYNIECSLCGYKVEKSGVGDKLSLDNFCPNCGADMRGENDGKKVKG